MRANVFFARAIFALNVVCAGLLPLRAQDSVVTGVLRISSVNELQEAAAAFANNAQPGSGAALLQGAMTAAQMGVDPSKEILAVLLHPARSSQPWALILPVTDGDSVIGNPAFGFMHASKPGVFRTALFGGGQEMYAAVEGRSLIVAPMEANVALLRPLVAGGAVFPAVAALRSKGGQIGLSVSPAQLYLAYKPMMDFFMAGLRAQSGGDAASQMGLAAVESVLAFFGDVEGLEIRIDIQPAALRWDTVLRTRAGSAVRDFLTLGRGAAIPSLAAHSPESGLLGTVSMKPGPAFYKAYNDLIALAFEASGEAGAKEVASRITDWVADFSSYWDGTGSFGGFVPGSKSLGSGVYGVTDAAKAMAALKSWPEIQTLANTLDSTSAVKTLVSIEAESVEGPVTFVDFSQEMKATSPAGEEALRAIKFAGFGGKISSTAAVTSSRVVTVFGPDSRQEAKRILAGQGGGAAVSPGDYGFEGSPNVFVAASLPRIIRWAALIGGAADSPKNLPDPAGKPGLALAFTGDGDGQLSFVVTAEEIKSVMKLSGAMAEGASGGGE